MSPEPVDVPSSAAPPGGPETAHPPETPGGPVARRFDRDATAGRLTLVAAVTVAAVAGLWWYGNRHDFFDLRIYVSAMRWWTDGHRLYDYAQPDPVQGHLYFTYPPFAAVLLRPLAHLPFGVVVALFVAGSAAGVVATTRWLTRPLAEAQGWPRWCALGVAVPLVFLAESTRETITLGQINMLLIVLVLADLLFWVPGERRWAGVGIGLATALKLFPGLFIVYLLACRRWRASLTAGATAAAATVLAAVVAPGASWQFWTGSLWNTARVGRTDYTGNQSLQGLLSRLTVPEPPSRLAWVALVALVAGFGLWRAARAGRAGDHLAGLTLTGLVAALISPITWPHHVYWFLPAIVVLVAAAAAPGPLRRRVALLGLAVLGYGVAAYGVVSFVDFGVGFDRTDSVGEFLLRNMYVLLALALLITLPIRPRPLNAHCATSVVK